MKKSIGLTADISTFNTTLPQTRHLNYFMDTNPRRYANGGDVNQGIPNYPNPNVTNGFLPMALGFDNGGEANAGLLEKIDKIMLLFGGDVLKVIEYLKKFFGYTDEEINSALNQKNAQPPMGAVDTQPQPVEPKQLLTPKDTVAPTPSDRQPGIGISNNMPPLIPSDRQPQFNLPPSSVPPPKISIEQRQRDFEDEQKAPDTVPGITSIIPRDRQPGIGTSNEMEPKEELPFYLKAFDLNGDGEVNMEDYNIAKEKGLSIADAILKYIQGALGEGTTPDKVEVPGQGGPVDTVPSPVKPKIKEEDKITKDDKEDKIIEEDNGIAGLPKVSEEQIKRDAEDKQTGLSMEDQKTLKAGADIAAGGDGGITDKKDVPAWALPMMSAGFAMMASKSPYFMQALGEAGQAGVETYAGQKEAKEKRLDSQSTRELQKAQADSYTNKVSGTPFVHSSGYLYRYRGDQAIPLLDEKGQKIRSIPTDAEIIKSLTTEMGIQFTSLSDVQQRELIEKRKNLLLGQIQTSLSNTEGGDSGDGSFWKDKIDGILKYIEGLKNAKDGGIVSLRR